MSSKQSGISKMTKSQEVATASKNRNSSSSVGSNGNQSFAPLPMNSSIDFEGKVITIVM